MKWGIGAVLALACATAQAEPRHLVYAEVLGKAGPYGIGYEYAFAPRLALGFAGSYIVMRDQRLATGAMYGHVSLLQGKRNAMFGELGALLAHSDIPSPVSDWDGMSKTGSGGFVSLGWEHATRHLVLRASGTGVAGAGGTALTVGFLIGVRP